MLMFDDTVYVIAVDKGERLCLETEERHAVWPKLPAKRVWADEEYVIFAGAPS